MSGLSSIFRAFYYRNYRLFFFGQGVSFLGTMMQNTAQAWLIYRITGSAAMLGIVAFAGNFPAFFMAPVSGILSDRVERRKIILVADIFKMSQAIVLTALVVSGFIQPWHIIVLAIILGTANGLETTARHSMVPEIVDDKKDLGNAIALNSMLFNSGRIVGPALAGFVVAYTGEGFCFAANAASYVALIWALMSMNLPAVTRRTHKTHPVDDLKEGYRYAFSFKPLRDILFLTAFVNLTGASAVVLMPVIAADMLSGGPKTLGTLMGSIGAGALLGALYLASRKKIPGLGKVIAAAAGVFGVALCLLSFSGAVAAAVAVLVFAGAGMMLHSSASNTLIQSVADDHLRGRVMSFYNMAVTGFGPLGNLATGYAAKAFGVRPVVLALGMLTLAGACVFAINLPAMKQLLRPVYVKKGFLAEEQ